MKVKSHSGLKKRLKVKKSGALSFNKAARRHLLTNKSKKQKRSQRNGVPVYQGGMKHVRRLLSGKAQIHVTRKRQEELKKLKEKKEEKKA
jgi:large subunit ribosomal protein L35